MTCVANKQIIIVTSVIILDSDIMNVWVYLYMHAFILSTIRMSLCLSVCNVCCTDQIRTEIMHACSNWGGNIICILPVVTTAHPMLKFTICIQWKMKMEWSVLFSSRWAAELQVREFGRALGLTLLWMFCRKYPSVQAESDILGKDKIKINPATKCPTWKCELFDRKSGLGVCRGRVRT